ncbi:MAG: hypothetical protein HC874_18540 [Richelia sp. SL_2_1]|nr:hypothetical protein [Richelia sp. SM2_1_7]NJM18191.1 hypothetical protein [Richelia sp. SM1_7_0]NJN08481.1 hypothetical protein [Richelia sp. RM1_1_1]NJO29307.1 hypothetical protein [Richelia sp. SL_2_1]
MNNSQAEILYRRWSLFWVCLGPLSWLVSIPYIAIKNQQAWGGLGALFYTVPVIAAIHLIAPLALLYMSYRRRERRQQVGRWVWLGWLYYVCLPILLLLISIQVQGLSQTLEFFIRLINEIRFQSKG